jgi:hypothetical protein
MENGRIVAWVSNDSVPLTAIGRDLQEALDNVTLHLPPMPLFSFTDTTASVLSTAVSPKTQ